ncbi:MAG: hypothetical protein WC760_06365 [Bacteroidia bacterium]|jgi:hypothetical protein
MRYIIVGAGSFDIQEFYWFRILSNGTKISAVSANGYDVLAILGITALTELKKGTVIRTPIQFPFDSITTTAGAIGIEPKKLFDVPDYPSQWKAAVEADGGTVEAYLCSKALIQSLIQ